MVEPLTFREEIELKDDLGNKPESPEHYSLCRCGESRNKPFCDGSHFEVYDGRIQNEIKKKVYVNCSIPSAVTIKVCSHWAM